ncbi:RICIN domain-containing protein [Streptomyces griseofuscus]|uniref:golvesin C-terminal-like domain-containing protein n=1 Tax=Streptomyces griseofuscus TaxID=146922 RepID=UPI00345214A4
MPTVVVDNGDAGFSSHGSWTASKASSHFYGADYLYAGSGTGATARWTPDVPTSGTYGVYYWIPDGSPSRTATAQFRVHSADPEYTTKVNEQAAGGTWVLLGNDYFDAGSGGYVELSGTDGGFLNADAVKLGPPGQMTIEAQIDRAVAQGRHDVTIEPGEYRRTSTLNLGTLSDFTIDAQGVRIVQTRLVEALFIGAAKNLTVNGLTIDYDPLPFTQGTVVAKSADGKSMDVRISTGYARPDKLPDRVTIFDPRQRLPKSQKLGATVSWVDRSTGVARSSTGATAANVGDIVTFAGGPAGGPSDGIEIEGQNTTLKDVTLNAAPGMGLMSARGEGGTHLDGFQIVPGPPPPGATEKPILTTSWDAIQFQSVKKGPTVENSRVVNAGDDSFSIQGSKNVKVVKTAGSTVWLAFPDNSYRVGKAGDRLQRWAGDPVATIRTMTRETDPAVTALAGARSGSTWRATLDQTSPWKAGTDVADIDRMGNGFAFRNNDIDSSGRGLLIEARDGVIENNRIRGANAVSLSSEMWSDSDSGAGGDITIKGNTFLSALWSANGIWDSCQVGTVTLDDDGTYSHRIFPDITIEDNVFQDIRGLNLNISEAKGVTVRDNVFQRSQQSGYNRATGNKCNIPLTSVVHVHDSDDVTFEGNTIDRIGPYSVGQVTYDSGTTTGITGLPDGVQVVNRYLPFTAGAAYTLTNRNSGQLLTAGGTAAGTGVVQQKAGQAGQSWRISAAGGDKVRIQNGDSGLFLTAGTGTAVLQEPQTDDAAQLWQLLDTGNGTAKILNMGTGKLLDISSASTASGAAANQAAVSGYLDQDWQFVTPAP